MYWPAVKAQNKTRTFTNFVVVDSPLNCAAGHLLFGAEGVEFCSDFEQLLAQKKSIRLLNVAGTLHYCLDYEGALDLLSRSDADFIVISRHPAPDDGQPPAYTIQNVTSINGFCGHIAVVLLSVEMVSDLMHKRGYSLIADYYSESDTGKYWKGGRQAVTSGYERIIDHALVFQKQRQPLCLPSQL